MRYLEKNSTYRVTGQPQHVHFFEPQGYNGHVGSAHLNSLLLKQLALLSALHQVDLYGPVECEQHIIIINCPAL